MGKYGSKKEPGISKSGDGEDQRATGPQGFQSTHSLPRTRYLHHGLELSGLQEVLLRLTVPPLTPWNVTPHSCILVYVLLMIYAYNREEGRAHIWP